MSMILTSLLLIAGLVPLATWLPYDTAAFAIPLLLNLLALLDAAFAGFRDAAGRCLLLHKRRYYRRAALRGLGYGVVVALLGGLSVAVALWVSSEPQSLYRAYIEAGERMLWVYSGYAALVLLALSIYLVPRPEISSLATVLVLGPFTLSRPWVIVAGALYGAVSSPRLPVWLTIAIAAGLLAAAGPILDRLAWNPRELDEQAKLQGL